jgi:tRNA nucleotidyltransferase/poly(A) polymerase
VKKQFKVEHPAAPVVIHPANITITSAEKKVFDILAETVKHFKLDTVLRVAGGWVRDKILGNDAGDIDIAVDNLTGVDFATLVQNYLKNHGDEQNLHIVKVNPSKSKHLETAIMHLNDFEVNFNHLRSEEYEANSRIPTATPFGTPLEDIIRRDLTVNSLYYNLSTETIEDFSGQAIADLKAGLLRTTYSVVHNDRLKDAHVDPTILEDPLRAVRVVRFASKFDFKIDELLMKSLKHEETKKALQQLVSPERVGIELDKIFDMPTPKIVRGVTNFHECNLLANLFYPITAVNKDKKFQLDLALERTKKYAEIFMKTPELEVYNDLLLGAFVSPVVDKKNGLRLARELCTKLAIRSGRRDSVLHVLQMALEFLPLLDNVNKAVGVIPTEKYSPAELDAKYSAASIEALGLWLRKVSSQAWALVMYLSRLLRVDSMDQIGQLNDPNLYAQEEALMRRLNANDFAFRAISMRPILTGHDIMSLLELPSSPKIGYYMGKLVLWQINTGKTSREEAQEYLKQLASTDAAQIQSRHPNKN